MSKILTIGNPILRKKSQPVKKVDRYIEKLVEELKKTLIKSTFQPLAYLHHKLVSY